MVHGCTCPEICSVHWNRRSAERKAALREKPEKKAKKETKKEEPKEEPKPEYDVFEKED